MTRTLPALLAALFALPLLAAPVPKAVKRKGDAERIVGEWEETPGARDVWIFRDDGTSGWGHPANPSCKAIYKIDPTQSPKHLDWSLDNGKTWYLSVYELDGDTLRVRFGVSGSGVRPTSVAEGKGVQFITTTRRVKDE